MKKIICSLLALSFLLNACSEADENKNYTPTQSARTSQVKGKEMFRAVFFLQGQVVNEIPELLELRNDFYKTEHGENILTLLNEFGDDIIGEIERENPAYFDEFEEKLKSDNFYEIEETLSEAIDTVTETAKKTEKYGALIKISEQSFNDIEIQNFINEHDMSLPENTEELAELINRKYEIENQTTAILGCTPYYAWCVYKVAGVAVSYGVALYTAAAYMNVWAVEAYWYKSREEFIRDFKNSKVVKEISRVMKR